MNTIDVKKLYDWFVEVNKNNGLEKVKLNSYSDRSIIVKVASFASITLSNEIGDIRFEADNIRSLEYSEGFILQIFAYKNGGLMRLSNS